jgi:hypothetical protein
LKNDLTTNPGKFTIVFSHHPLLPPPPFDTGPPWDEYIATQGDSAREILNRSKDVRLAVSGHLHVSKIQRERDIWYVASPSLDVYPCAFRIFRVKPESITVETYQITFPALLKRARQLLDGSNLAFKYNQSKPQLFADLCFGQRADQTCVLPLRAPAAVAPAPSKKDEKRDKKKEKEEKKEEKKDEQSAKKDKKKEPKEKEPKAAKGKGKSKGKGKEKDTDEPEKAPSENKTETPSEKVTTPATKSDETAPTKGSETPPAKASEAAPDKAKETAPAKDTDTTKSTDDKKEAK